MSMKFKLDTKNAALISVVILIVGLAGLWLPYERSQRAKPTTDSIETAEVKIDYTKDGFVPSSISVPIGATVAWINRSGRPMWVASDPHPSHSNLPGFDQQKIINQKSSPFFKKVQAHRDGIYKYTFTKAGEWQYHNHLYPAQRGIVIVVEK